jgi:hypothetical protein
VAVQGLVHQQATFDPADGEQALAVPLRRAVDGRARPWLVPPGERVGHAPLDPQVAEAGRRFSVPPGWLCTDNAAMIGWAGAERFAAGLVDALDVPARARWPLDPEGEKVRGAGVKA